jgi:hypothetical protein
MSTPVKVEQVSIIDQKGSTTFDLMPLVSEFNIIESLDFPCRRISLAINDSVNLIDSLRGNELIRIIVKPKTTNKSITYEVRAYRISNRIRFEKKEAYTIECVSPEFMINEISNVFKSYKNKKAHQIVKEISTDILLIPSSKLKIESTYDKVKCVIPNWRPFDVINWLGGRAVRESNQRQGGFIFYQNSEGYHFKSFDKIITDIKSATIPEYKYAMKNTSEKSDGVDLYTIESVAYPALFDGLTPLRNGTWAGIFSGVSLDYIPLSKVPTPNGNKQIPYGGTAYYISDVYSKMEHLGNENPYASASPQYDVLINSIRRNRYRTNQLHLWDKNTGSSSSSVGPTTGEVPVRWEETAIYNFCRKNNFEHIKLEVRVPGNLKLTPGQGVYIEIPKMLNTKKSSNKIELDRIYSGKYVIAGVKHRFANGNTLFTEMTVVKDSLGIKTPT